MSNQPNKDNQLNQVNYYRKKPVTIKAIQWTGNNHAEVNHFLNYKGNDNLLNHHIVIETLEGNMFASVGDYIIQGVQGEYYPCKPDIFHQTYELV